MELRVGPKSWKAIGALWTLLLAAKVIAAVWAPSPWDSPSAVGRAVPTVALAVFVGAAAALALWRCAIRITPTHLIVRGLFRTRSFAWDDILAVNGGSSWISVTTRSGTFVLPWVVLATEGGVLGRFVRSYDGVGMIRGVIEGAWVQRRGEHWFSAPLDPWTATHGLDGRIVLRRPWAQWAAFTVLVLDASYGIYCYGSDLRGYLLVAAAATIGVATFGLVQTWVDVLIIEPDAVVVRTVLTTRRIPRTDIVRVTLEQGDAPAKYALWGPTRRVLIQTRTDWVCLPAPASGGLFIANDPLFLRKAAWLEHELRAVPTAPATPTEGARTEPGHPGARWSGPDA